MESNYETLTAELTIPSSIVLSLTPGLVTFVLPEPAIEGWIDSDMFYVEEELVIPPGAVLELWCRQATPFSSAYSTINGGTNLKVVGDPNNSNVALIDEFLSSSALFLQPWEAEIYTVPCGFTLQYLHELTHDAGDYSVVHQKIFNRHGPLVRPSL